MHNFLVFKELAIINLTWYWPTPMCLGSIFTNSAKGSSNRLAMETIEEQCTFNINHNIFSCIYNYLMNKEFFSMCEH